MSSVPNAVITSSVNDLPIVDEMLAQTERSLAAASAIDANSLLVNAGDALKAVQAGSQPISVAAIMPSNVSVGLTTTLSNVAVASTSGLEQVNAAVRLDGQQPDSSNTPPMISGSPQGMVVENTGFSFTPSVNDVDGDSLNLQINNLPAWASFNPDTGALTGTPDAQDVGVYSGIVISVSDGVSSASLPTFSIEVLNAPNNPPTISGTPETIITLGSPYTFVPSANDIDGDNLNFSVTNLPTWANFNVSTGALNGTPVAVGQWDAIVISVSDGIKRVSLPSFDITVSNPPNVAPTISGSPLTTVEENTAYNFVPTANDADGDTLSFSVTNLPTWASFNPANGTISGTPGSLDVGTSNNIVMRVSDGVASSTLPAFTIEVTAISTTLGTASLSWLPPTENSDGTTLTDLAGFKIHYGTAPGVYTSVITVNSPGISSYVVDNLPGGKTYFFVVTAYTASGIESEFSTEGSKTIP